MKKIYILIFSILSFLVLSQINAEAKQLEKLQGDYESSETIFSIHPGNVDTDSLESVFIYFMTPKNSSSELKIPYLGISKTQTDKRLHKYKLSAEEALCYLRKPGYYPVKDSVWQGRAISILNDKARGRVCYVVAKYPNSSESLAVNTLSELGKTYVISTLPDPVEKEGGYKTKWLPPYVSISAVYDDTRVKFTSYGVKINSEVKFMQKGDVWLIPADGEYADLSGSFVKADKPISVTSGNYLAGNLGDSEAGNYTIEEEVHVHKWGNTYLVPHIYGREKHADIQVFAKHSASRIKKNSKEIIELHGPGGPEDNGWTMIKPGINDVNEPVSITGNRPIHTVLYNMPGEDEINDAAFKMNLSTIWEFENNYRVYLFDNENFGFTRHYQSVVFENDTSLLPDNFKALFKRNGENIYKPVNDLSGIIDVLDVKPFNHLDGFHEKWYCATLRIYPDSIESNYISFGAVDEFGLYSYGFDNKNGAYAHPAQSFGVPVQPDMIPPQPKWTIDAFGNVPAKGDPPDSAIVTDWGTDPRFPPNDPDKTANLGFIYFDQMESNNFDFDYEQFIPGKDRSTTWQLTTRDSTKQAKAVITFADRAGNDTTVTILYMPDSIEVEKNDIILNRQYNVLEDKIRITNHYANDPVEIHLEGEKFQQLDVDHKTPFILKPGESDNIRFSIDNDLDSVKTLSRTIKYKRPADEFEMVKEFKVYINSKAALPVLYSDGIDFGDVYKDRSKDAMLEISNPASEGAGDTLKIDSVLTGQYAGAAGSGKVFEIDFPDEPIIIPVDSSAKLKVRFNPNEVRTWNVELKFSTNQILDKIEPILSGTGEQVTEIKSSAQWSRSKADPNYYKKDKFMEFDKKYHKSFKAIRLDNNSGKEITITGFKFTERREIDGKAFFLEMDGKYEYFDSASVNELLLGQTIESGNTIDHPVYFLAPDEGEFDFYLYLFTDKAVNYMFYYRGAGTIPKITVDTSVYMGEPANPYAEIQKDIEIENNASHNTGVLNIYDIEGFPEEYVSDDWKSYNGKNFKFKKPDMPPLAIDAGSSHELKTAFRKNMRADSVYLKIRSDAKEDPVILLWVDEETGVHYQFVDNSFDIYPNPADNNINITGETSINNVTIQIFNALGKKVYERKGVSFGSGFSLNTGNLVQGRYHLIINSDGKIFRNTFNIMR